MVLVLSNADIPAKNEITALVPDIKRFIITSFMPHLEKSDLTLFIESREMNLILLLSITLSSNFRPSKYITQKPKVAPKVAAANIGSTETPLLPTIIQIVTNSISLGAGGNKFSMKVVANASRTSTEKGILSRITKKNWTFSIALSISEPQIP